MPRSSATDPFPNSSLTDLVAWGVTREAQVALLLELRDLSNSIAGAFQARDDRLLALALALSGGLSCPDMTTATGLNKSRVDQIIREMRRG